MARTSPPNTLPLRPSGEGKPLATWLYDELRLAIIEGRLRPNAQIPSSRVLSAEYGVARGTAIAAFEALRHEGYIESRKGSGSFVATNLPDKFFRSAGMPTQQSIKPSEAKLSRWGQQIRLTFPARKTKRISLPFEANLPALDLFPTALWARLAGRQMRQANPRYLGYGDGAGYLPLREAVANHLGSTRGVSCTAEQIVIVSGTQQTLQLTARLTLDAGDRVWVEDPGYIGAVAAFRDVGGDVVGVPVDEFGINVAAGERLAPRARLAYVTPAHQFPLGVGLSLERRLALLHWAQKSKAWIFEDDSESEFRFSGRPLPPVQSLDTSECVIFAGSFNKMLFPTLRLGYVVLPPRLVSPFLDARGMSDRFPPALEQRVLCDFITEGYFGQHLRRMREAYAERLQALMDEANTGPLAGLVTIAPIQAGIQTAAILPSRIPDVKASAAAAHEGMEIIPISTFQISRQDINGLMLGFANTTPASIRSASKKLGALLSRL
ncbi:MAG: PLP-dependent aminotransferase family protein [Gemmatimonadaceae bacterium]